MTMILRLVRYHMADGREAPDDLEAFMRENTQQIAVRDPGRDPYGNVYVLQEAGLSGLALVSPGPDRRIGTDDDIVVR